MEPTPTEILSTMTPPPGHDAAAQRTVDASLEATAPISPPLARLTPTECDELVGQSLDVYTIKSLLGRGSMGKVYLAHHERLHRPCAVKVLTHGAARMEPALLDMFYSEARSAARLSHPNIVTVHSLGESQGYYFIEMEYVEGTSLREFVSRHGRLDALTATRMMTQIAGALAEAHEHNVVHCDVKPDNVMVNAEAEAKLADFGLARLHAADVASTLPGMVGTPVFMAPELFMGGTVNRQTDIYSLGATYFALLTGKVPHQGSKLGELAARHAQRVVPRVEEHEPHAPKGVCDLVAELMNSDAERRPAADLQLVRRLSILANTLVDTSELVAAAMKDLDVDWKIEGTKYKFHVRQANGRKQHVEAEVVKSPSGELVFSIWSPCSAASASAYEYVLELNSRIPFGAVSLHNFQGKPYFAVVQNHLRSTLDPPEIRSSIFSVAEWADRIEHTLTGDDLH